MKVLVPVRYPITDDNIRAIQRGIELIEGQDDPELLIFHMNEVHTNQRIRRNELREAVETVFENLEASYVVRDGFIVEEAIIEYAIRMDLDHIVLSRSRRERWSQLLEEIFHLDRDPEGVIREKTDIGIDVVTDERDDSSQA